MSYMKMLKSVGGLGLKTRSKIPLCVFIALWLCFFHSALASGQLEPVVGLHENKPRVAVFKNARIVISPYRIIDNAVLVLRNGLIEKVGKNISIPSDAVVQDLEGRTIYPGFIDLYTHYGLSEGEKASSPSLMDHWNQFVTPHREAVELFLTDAKAAQELRKSGFTVVQTLPRKGIFRGSGALVLLKDAKNKKVILKDSVSQSMSFRRPSERDRTRTNPTSLMGSIALIRQTFLDSQWYKQAWDAYNRAPAGQNTPVISHSLKSLQPCTEGVQPVIFDTSDVLDILRAAKIAREFNLNLWVCGSGYEYRRIEAIKTSGAKLILPLNFPGPPDVSTNEVSLRDLRHWNFVPENPARLSKSGIDFSLTTAKLDKAGEFLKNVRTAVKCGFSPENALAALTTTPAEWLHLSHILGTIEAGKIANFFITDGDFFKDQTKILQTWVAGERFQVNPLPEMDVRGSWRVKVTPKEPIDTLILTISGEITKPAAEIRIGETSTKALTVVQEKRLLHLAFPADAFGVSGIVRMEGMLEKETIKGHGTWGDGSGFKWHAELSEPWKDEPIMDRGRALKSSEFPLVYPEGAFGRLNPPDQPKAILIKNAVIWTCGPDGILEKADILVEKGKIVKVGKNLHGPEGSVFIDGTGKHVTPGIIDAHTHIATTGGVNESSGPVTPEVRIGDILDSSDINIYRLLAGGLTMTAILHGSGNPIGGQNEVIKLRWGELPDEIVCRTAKPSIKFALGENVKNPFQSYPDTRMGVEQIIRDAFLAAKDYRLELQEYKKDLKKNRNLIPPRRNLRYEALLEVLDGKRWVRCHAYRQDEILALIRLADEIGFKVKTIEHANEGYKVADVLAKHGTMPSVHADWWMYKFEVYDGIPYNGALMHKQGVVVSFNSDNPELARRLNYDAAKAVKYGNLSQEEALKFVTLNPAKQLGVDDRVGSLEPGKDADFVIWNGSPLLTYSRCESTWIDGRKYFDISEDHKLRDTIKKQRAELIQKILNTYKE